MIVPPSQIASERIGQRPSVSSSTTTEASRRSPYISQFAHYLCDALFCPDRPRLLRALQPLPHRWALNHSLQFPLDPVREANTLARRSIPSECCGPVLERL
jgi:hypothetical protein